MISSETPCMHLTSIGCQYTSQHVQFFNCAEVDVGLVCRIMSFDFVDD